jgi:acetyl-CoA synthetase
VDAGPRRLVARGHRLRPCALAVEADHPALIIYTSGTTGRPKGTVLTQGGFGIKNAHDWAYVFDMDDRARMFWVTDLGWLMGPMLITGTLLHGATVVLFEGTPDYPKPDRLWDLCERHRVTHLGICHGHARSCHGADWIVKPLAAAHHRLDGRAVEPRALPLGLRARRGRRCAHHQLLGRHGDLRRHRDVIPDRPDQPCPQRAIPGWRECFGEDGRPVRGAVGELVVTKPWPGMTKGFWQDPDRYIETYWSRWKDVWVHGDWAFVDDDGFWYIHGRSDDTLKIAGKRVGPAEVESVLVGDPAVNEAAAVGVPHEVKGESVVCFCVLRLGHEPTEALRAELIERVAQAMGKALKPERVLFVRELPKTRSAKIMRRVIRAAYLGNDPGDLSSLDNPGGVTAIGEAV